MHSAELALQPVFFEAILLDWFLSFSISRPPSFVVLVFQSAALVLN